MRLILVMIMIVAMSGCATDGPLFCKEDCARPGEYDTKYTRAKAVKDESRRIRREIRDNVRDYGRP